MLNTTRRQARLILGAAAIAVVAMTGCEPVPQTQPTPPTPPTPPTTTEPATPSLSTVRCATGSTITVAQTIATDVQALLDDAATDGVRLCGGGYRDSAGQIAARKRNCGTSYYDIWEKPSGQCSPPTAKPGTSMHEKGLAVDFTNCSTRSTACYQWLAGNAERFGLKNLPPEPWHWSTNGW